MKLLAQCSLTNQVVHASREWVHDCEPHRGRELGRDDMANQSEPLINVVRSQQAKGAVRLEPKGAWPVAVFPHHCPQMWCHRRTGGAYLIHGTRAERGKPVSLP